MSWQGDEHAAVMVFFNLTATATATKHYQPMNGGSVGFDLSIVGTSGDDERDSVRFSSATLATLRGILDQAGALSEVPHGQEGGDGTVAAYKLTYNEGWVVGVAECEALLATTADLDDNDIRAALGSDRAADERELASWREHLREFRRFVMRARERGGFEVR